MKKLTAVVLTFLACTALWAQDSTAVRPTTTKYYDQGTVWQKNRIRHLPAAVRLSLSSPDYREWEISEAYEALITDPERPISAGLLIYIIDLRRRDERRTIKFDEEGRRIN